MRTNLLAALLANEETVSIYSPRLEGEEYTEFERFILAYKDLYTRDVHILLRRIEIIKQNGAEDRFFRCDESQGEAVALSSYLDTTNLRLCCLNASPRVLILGNGGIKAALDDENVAQPCKPVQTLQRLRIDIKRERNTMTVTIEGSHLLML